MNILLVFRHTQKRSINITIDKLKFEFSDEELPLINDVKLFVKEIETDEILGYIYKSTIRKPDKWEDFLNSLGINSPIK